ncbi:MAG: hypothetical protein AAF266_02265 [Planctomycetota bacterium]
MSSDDLTLYRFSIGVAIWALLMLIVPILRRKSDVFTAWNFFLVGVFTFNGRSGLNAATTPHYLPDISGSSYSWYYLGTVVFYATITATYYFFKYPRRLAGRTLLKWPKITAGNAPILATCLMAMIVGLVVPIPIPVVGQLLSQFALVVPGIALAFMTIVWYRDRTNVVLLAFLVAFAFIAVAAALGAGISRRYLMSSLSAIPVGLYWVWLRYKPTPTILTIIAVALASTVPVVAGFTAIRFSLQDEEVTAVQRAQRLLQALPDAIRRGGSSEGFSGQDSVECALCVIELLNNGSKRMEVDPLYSLKYILANPVPRELWPGKPSAVGAHLVYKFGLRGTNANLGLNVVGQCFYDGGIVIHVLYAIMMGAFLRYYDELMVRQPGNPLLVGGFVAMSAQILGWPRGGIEVFGLQIIQGFVLIVLTSLLARLVYGVGVVYPRTDHIENFPVLRSQADWQRWMGSFTGGLPAANREQYLDSEDED